MMSKIYFISWYYHSCWYKLNLNILTGTLKIYKKNNFDFTVPLASSDPEANSLGSIVLKSTLQHLFSCSYYT